MIVAQAHLPGTRAVRAVLGIAPTPQMLT
jgi:hypothetical protein